MIELALLTPVLLVILLVTAEFSRVFYQYNTLTKSVRNGTRYLSEHTLSANRLYAVPQSRLNETRNLVVSGLPQGGTALLDGLGTDDVEIVFGSKIDGALPRYYVTVEANYNYVPLAPVLDGMGFLGESSDVGFQLSARSSMRAQ